MSKALLGVDLGGTNVKVGCFDSALKLLARVSKPTNVSGGPEAVVEGIVAACKEAVKEAGLSMDDVAAAGMGVPGPVNLKEGIIVAAPNMPNFHNVPMRQMLSDALGKPVVMENDANAAAWGEFVRGAAQDVTEMIFFTLGTGIGGGVVCNNGIVHGHKDVGAELGHVILYPDGERVCGCGQKGCVEAYASANSTAARATEAVMSGRESSMKSMLDSGEEITCKDVFDHAAQGDALATEIVEGTAKALGLMCINMYHTTGPQRIVFAGGMIAAGDALLDRIKDFFDKNVWSFGYEIDICFATLGEDAGIIGAAALAADAGV